MDQVLTILTDEHQVVTAKYCSHRLHVDVQESKRLMQRVYDENRQNEHVVPVYAVYYNGSADEDDENCDGVEQLGMKLVQGENHADQISSKSYDKELYALAPEALDNIASLCFSTDSLCMRSMLNDNPHCFVGIKSEKLKIDPVAPVVQQKQPPVVSQRQMTKPVKTEPEKTKNTEKEKKTNAQTNLFAKKATSAPKKPAVKSEKIKTAQEVIEDEETVASKKTKKNRRIVLDDEEDEVDDVPKKNIEPDSEPVAEAKMDVDEQKKEAEVESKNLHQLGSSGGGTGARRLVERTYVDDEGYFVTEKTWTHDGGGASNAVEAPKPSKPAPKPAAPAPSKAAKAGKAPPGKQTSLTSFFKKV